MTAMCIFTKRGRQENENHEIRGDRASPVSFAILDSEGQVMLKYIYNAQGFPEMSKASFGGSRAGANIC